MAFYTDLFTVETYEAYLASDRTVSGFRESQRSMADRIQPGDKLLVYIKGLSRWAATLKVIDGPFIDRTPLFMPDDDPFVVRFHVEPSSCLPLEFAIPIREQHVFNGLSFSNGRENGYWLGPLRRSLQHIEDGDGEFLERLLLEQTSTRRSYPLQPAELDAHRVQQVKRVDGVVAVTVPSDEEAEEHPKPSRDSIRIQADLARLGELMRYRIWLPKGDRSRVLECWTPEEGSLIDRLPLNYDETTLRTIEQIDVIWLKGRAIQRAFEVEHSTAVYSGLLRMADLLALQPNMNIALHIVAPGERRDKVLNEIRRPVFSLIDTQPLAERCTFIAYESLGEIMALPHLGHMSDSVLDEYEDRAE
jgi:hypothetical protein